MSVTTAVQTRRLNGRIGAEILGVDIAAGVSDDVFEQINAALLEHKVIGFRDQHLDPRGQIEFLSRWGALAKAHPTVPALEGYPEILNVSWDESVRANNWHTDVTFVVSPPAITSLHALEVPPFGGETVIANSAWAYLDLPAPLREFADRLWAVHTNDYDYAQPQFVTEKSKARREVFVSQRWEVAHPVVRVHPVTGEKGLFIGGFANKIVGLSTTESRDVLRLLQAYVTRPENQTRWRWSAGDLVIFDNRITQHYAPDDYFDERRTLHRVTVAGPRPVSIDGKRSYVISGDDASHYTPAVD